MTPDLDGAKIKLKRSRPQKYVFKGAIIGPNPRQAFSRSRETAPHKTALATGCFCICRRTHRETKERNHHRRSARASRLRNQHRQHQSPIFRWSFRGMDIFRQVHVCPRLSNRLGRMDALHRKERLRRASEQHLAGSLPRPKRQRLPTRSIHRGLGVCRQRFGSHNQISRTTRPSPLHQI